MFHFLVVSLLNFICFTEILVYVICKFISLDIFHSFIVYIMFVIKKTLHKKNKFFIKDLCRKFE